MGDALGFEPGPDDNTVRTRRLVRVERSVEKTAKRVKYWLGLAFVVIGAVASAGFATATRLERLARTSQIDELRADLAELRRILAIYGEAQRRSDHSVDRLTDELVAIRRELAGLALAPRRSR